MVQSSTFEVEFWGVRGSVSTPGESTVRYGGNTSCVEVRAGDTRIIFDGGTGLRLLGQKLLELDAVEAHIFFSHSHWDHIQGFPFFRPAFLPKNCFHVYGGVAPNGSTMKDRLSDQMLHPNFPVPMQIMKADLQFHNLDPGETVAIGDQGVTVETALLNHPNTALGYRVNWRGKSVVYATDTEHYPDHIDENLIRLCRNADILIYDACYTDEEYHDPKSPKIGWGHSTWQEALKLVDAAGVKQVLMFHHDPEHDDDCLDQIEAAVRERHPHSRMAREGLVLALKPEEACV
ncbi:MBL fold metallo-hydrolase [filamentous cyanobacterium LEGE 11480]|uniref:MBL fold metallo-hydrolase n=1 Tax=Romeriopsis navalis LEGE 11480 TaxID=2777977 RepID=A0A928Z5J0_9CYAN|nr:MBL fold metallo-hydrolase [Romeriopsis navalis]MBE9032042.1 MBL fold metallo-hydrolase [Romeriopsis navalis LEGE 11480]